LKWLAYENGGIENEENRRWRSRQKRINGNMRGGNENAVGVSASSAWLASVKMTAAQPVASARHRRAVRHRQWRLSSAISGVSLSNADRETNRGYRGINRRRISGIISNRVKAQYICIIQPLAACYRGKSASLQR